MFAKQTLFFNKTPDRRVLFPEGGFDLLSICQAEGPQGGEALDKNLFQNE